MVRGNVDSLVKLITALDAAGIELIDEGANYSCAGRIEKCIVIYAK
jgi:hypothetical protein